MKRRIALLLSLILLVTVVSFPKPAKAYDDFNRTVRVRLSVGDITSAAITVKGNYTVNGTSFFGGTLTAALQSNGKVKLTHSSLGTLDTADEVYIERQEADKDEANLGITMSSGSVRTYLGDIKIFKDSSKSILRVVNYIPMHEYLYGAVSGEVAESSHVNLLRTQTIAAKCFALAEVNSSSSTSTFDVYDTTTSQLYVGYVATDVRTIAAVDEVWTQTLLYNGVVVKTHYGTANGGVILSPMMKWGGASAYEGAYELKYDPFDLLRSSNNVVIRIDGKNPSAMPSALYDAILRAAATKLGTSLSSIVSIESMDGFFVYKAKDYTTPTTFSVQLTVKKSSGETYLTDVTMNFDELVTSGVISATGEVHFVTKVGQSNWHLVYGIPSGPRVGMSHQGAKKMAEYGYSYVDILKFYYPNATLTTADGSAVPASADTSIAAVVGVIYGEQVISGSYYGYVNVAGASLMSLPSYSSINIMSFSEKKPIIVLDKVEEWIYIYDIGTGLYGYVYSSYISSFSRFVLVGEDDTNFRIGPGTEHDIITAIDTGEQLAVYGESGNWYNAAILRTGTVGYIYKSLCATTSTLLPPVIATPSPTPSPTPTGTPSPTQSLPPRPTPTVDPEIIPGSLGDVNGDGVISSADATCILRAIVKFEKHNPLQIVASDVDLDGFVTASDASRILRFVVKLVSTLSPTN